MRVQFAQPLRGRRGNDIKEPAAGGGLRSITLGDICYFVLDTQFEDDKESSQKLRRFELMVAITQAEDSLTPMTMLDSDLAMIKDRLLRSNLSASIVGCAHAMLSTPALEMEDDHASEARKGRRSTGDAQVQARGVTQREQQRPDSD